MTKRISIFFAAALILTALFLIARYEDPFGTVTPLVFVHGLGEDGSFWLRRDYDTLFSNNSTFCFNGDLQLSRGRVIQTLGTGISARHVAHPCFTVSLSDHAFGDIRESAKELSAFVDFVKSATKARKISLVGYSLGGVICREYLTSILYHGEVDSLITISAPHSGSEFAALFDLSLALQTKIKQMEADPTMKGKLSMPMIHLCENMSRALKSQAALHGVNLDAKALDMLHPPSEGNYLFSLNRSIHPADVKYFSIVTSKNITNMTLHDVSHDAQKLLAAKADNETATFAAMVDLLRRALSALPAEKPSAGDQLGDGFVSIYSQDMANITYMRTHPELRIRSVTIDAPHLETSLQKQLVNLILDH